MSIESRAPETVVARLRPHARVLVAPTLALLAIVGAFFYFFGSLPEEWMNLAVLFGAVLGIIVLWFLPLVSWLGSHYTITTRRIVVRNGFFVRVRQELLHSRGYDVSVRQNAIQSLFRSGDVRINTGLEHPVVLSDVPSVNLVQAALHDLMEDSLNPVAARRQEQAAHPQAAHPDETTWWGSR